MKPAKPNNYGITNVAYVTDMSDSDDLRTQLKKAEVGYQETALNMGTLFAEPACIISYVSPKVNRVVSVLILPLVGPDSWCEEYYSMVGIDHEAALSRNWPDIIKEVRDLYQP